MLRSIDGMLRTAHPEVVAHARLDFEPCAYTGENGRQEPMYRMTAKGLSELAMSFSGC